MSDVLNDETGFVYFCCDERRRAALRRPGQALNGIDFLEVVDGPTVPLAERQKQLLVFFVKPIPPSDVLRAALAAPGAVRITGGDRVPNVSVVSASLAPAGDFLDVRVDRRGDFSPYTLRLVGPDAVTPPAGLDPLLAAVDFSFKVACATDFDCAGGGPNCPPGTLAEPEIDYLAKDFTSLRQLLLDRMRLTTPGWTERNPADVGVALVEMLAYVGDHLSYQQDAVATEAYLGTARRRASVRRHAQLLDYSVGDGTNARAFVHVAVREAQPSDSVNGIRLRAGTPLFSRLGEPFGAVIAPGTPGHVRALASAPAVFETMHDAVLWPGHDALPFYAWGASECCLPAGATRATLAGHFPHLAKGGLLVFEEVRGPRTGAAEDARPARRHAVRLVAAPRLSADPLFEDAPVTEIVWHAEDALPFALTLSSVADADHGGRPVENVSIARANIVLADHGRTVENEPLGAPLRPNPVLAPVHAVGHCADTDTNRLAPPPARFSPRLREGPLTQTARAVRTGRTPGGDRERLLFDPNGSAASVFATDAARVLPAIRLRDANNRTWQPRSDLLGSDAFAAEFIAETDEEGRAALRFGDDELGERPSAGLAFFATYRVGNGAAGNVGADALRHVVTDDPAVRDRIVGARNPLAARGGTDPETLERVRQDAPVAFRTAERAVTPDDYARIAERHGEVQRAHASLRWTGSWRTVFLTIDRTGGRPVDAEFENRLRAHLERFRLAGHDLEIAAPVFVPLEVELLVCAAPGYFRGDVERALRQTLGSRTLANGRRGLFHPDNFTFGQSVLLGPIYAAAQSVAGVESVVVRVFQRQDQPSRAALDAGALAISPREIARLDDDPNFPERGALRLIVQGGR